MRRVHEEIIIHQTKFILILLFAKYIDIKVYQQASTALFQVDVIDFLLNRGSRFHPTCRINAFSSNPIFIFLHNFSFKRVQCI